MKEFRTNNNIPHYYNTSVIFIDAEGKRLGFLPFRDALERATEVGLDLVEIQFDAEKKVSTCKVMDYGKYKFDMSKKEKENMKKSKTAELKSVQIRQNTDPHDLDIKSAQIQKFLSDGHPVRISVAYKGREVVHAEIGKEKIKYMLTKLGSTFKTVVPLNMEGKSAFVEIEPLRGE